MKTIDRLKQFIDEIGISYNAFDIAIGAANGYIGKSIKKNGSVGSDMIEKIISIYPKLNPLWLISGQGTMFKNADTPPEGGDTADNNPQNTPIAGSITGALSSPNTSASTSPTNKYRLRGLSNNYSLVSENAFKYGVNTPKVITINETGVDNILYVPVRARAGYLLGHGDQEFIESLPTFRMPGLSNATYRMFEVEGVSMAPTLSDRDRVIGEWVPSVSEIRDNRIHVLVTADGVLIKRVLNRVDKRGKLYLKSDTITNRADYPMMEVNPEEILEIWYINMKVSSDLTEPAEIYKRVSDLEIQNLKIMQKLGISEE